MCLLGHGRTECSGSEDLPDRGCKHLKTRGGFIEVCWKRARLHERSRCYEFLDMLYSVYALR